MKILCLIKFVPDVDSFSYDKERNVLVRENSSLILNPDDGKALGLALQLKKADPAIQVIAVTMRPLSVREQMYDVIRRGADMCVMLSDKAFVGSDTYATAKILGTYIKKECPDLILAGSETLDGGTAHIPAQLAEYLDLNLLSNVLSVSGSPVTDGEMLCDVTEGDEILTYAIKFPAVVGIAREAAFRLPFVRYFNLDKDVSGQLSILTNEELGLPDAEIGLKGSKTRVASSYVRKIEAPMEERIVLMDEDEGVDYVFRYLKEKGYLHGTDFHDH